MKSDKNVRKDSSSELNSAVIQSAELEFLDPMVTDTGEGTHIRISKKHYKELTDLGKKNETYDQIIGRLIRFYKEHHNNK